MDERLMWMGWEEFIKLKGWGILILSVLLTILVAVGPIFYHFFLKDFLDALFRKIFSNQWPRKW